MNAQATTPKGKTIQTPAELLDLGIGIFVPIYRACAQLGTPANVVDEMETWQVASMLGIGMDDGTSDAPHGHTGGPPAPGSLSHGRSRRARKA